MFFKDFFLQLMPPFPEPMSPLKHSHPAGLRSGGWPQVSLSPHGITGGMCALGSEIRQSPLRIMRPDPQPQRLAHRLHSWSRGLVLSLQPLAVPSKGNQPAEAVQTPAVSKGNGAGRGKREGEDDKGRG